MAKLPDWQDLREAGRQIKDRVKRHLPEFLEQLEASIIKAGGIVHWARDADEANQIISSIVQSHKATQVIKVKSITTDEIGLNDALARDGIEAIETDLAELIVQLAHDHPSHILVPAIHKNRAEIRALFLKALEGILIRPGRDFEDQRVGSKSHENLPKPSYPTRMESSRTRTPTQNPNPKN